MANPKTVTTTKPQLAAAFDEWLRRRQADPDQFDEAGGEDYGQACADYLTELLAEVA